MEWISLCSGFLGVLDSKESTCNVGDLGLILGLGRSPGEGNGTYSSILAWRIPWKVEPGRLQSMGSQRIKYDCATFTFTFRETNFLTHLSPLHGFISTDFSGWSSHYFMLSNFNCSLLCTCFYLCFEMPFPLYTMFLKLYLENIHIVGMQSLYYTLMLLIC